MMNHNTFMQNFMSVRMQTVIHVEMKNNEAMVFLGDRQ